jgi:hypothetical protein
VSRSRRFSLLLGLAMTASLTAVAGSYGVVANPDPKGGSMIRTRARFDLACN